MVPLQLPPLGSLFTSLTHVSLVIKNTHHSCISDWKWKTLVLTVGQEHQHTCSDSSSWLQILPLPFPAEFSTVTVTEGHAPRPQLAPVCTGAPWARGTHTSCLTPAAGTKFCSQLEVPPVADLVFAAHVYTARLLRKELRRRYEMTGQISNQVQDSTRQTCWPDPFYTYPAPFVWFSAYHCLCSSLLPFPLWVLSELHIGPSVSAPFPIRGPPGLQSYQLQSPRWSSWKLCL